MLNIFVVLQHEDDEMPHISINGVSTKSDMPWLLTYVIVTLTHVNCIFRVYCYCWLAVKVNISLISDIILCFIFTETPWLYSNRMESITILNGTSTAWYLIFLIFCTTDSDFRKDEPPWMDAAPDWFFSELINIQVKIYTWSKTCRSTLKQFASLLIDSDVRSNTSFLYLYHCREITADVHENVKFNCKSIHRSSWVEVFLYSIV
jgi:hypothetical protein